mgnify:CR=1 FL=1
MLKRIFDVVLDFIYPPKCVLCNKVVVNRKQQVCSDCSNNLKTICKIQYLDKEHTMKCVSVFRYIGNIKNSIWRFKFKGYKEYSKFYAKFMAQGIENTFKNIKFDFICFVPLRSERLKNRGYNQAECLASDISSIINVPCKDALVKIKNNHVQHELDIIHRRENVRGVYDIVEGINVVGKTILICDDIITSGSTLRECADVLLKNGAKSIYCCTIV